MPGDVPGRVLQRFLPHESPTGMPLLTMNTLIPILDLPPVAISIRQPWAWFILYAGKDFENRTWRSSFKGECAIHASLGLTRTEYEAACQFARKIGYRGPIPAMEDLPRGGIVGAANFGGCVSWQDPVPKSRWFEGPFGFPVSNQRPTEFIRCSGALGFFKHGVRL